MSCLLLQSRGKIRFLANAQGVLKVAWCGDRCFKRKHRWTFPPHHHTGQILLPQISTSLEPSKTPAIRKGLGVMTKLLKKSEEMKKWYKKGTVALVSRWRKAVEVDGDM
jgi:hypothetical protein